MLHMQCFDLSSDMQVSQRCHNKRWINTDHLSYEPASVNKDRQICRGIFPTRCKSHAPYRLKHLKQDQYLEVHRSKRKQLKESKQIRSMTRQRKYEMHAAICYKLPKAAPKTLVRSRVELPNQ
jgi:hypothetical protein